MSNAIKQAQELKGFKSQLSKLEGEYEVVKKQAAEYQKKCAFKKKGLGILKAKINRLSLDSNTIISEHAILRYFERVKGFDLSEIEKEILTPKVKEMIETLGNTGVYPNNNFQVCLKNNVIVTIK
tara:strand:+ start:1185 stop:1559 length:375 start_codon:yes stop_codon:yes gene_type:complete